MAVSPNVERDMELTRGDGREGRVEDAEEEVDGEGMGVQVEPVRDTLVDSEGCWAELGWWASW